MQVGAHPRSRGENRPGSAGHSRARGSSPLTRGKLGNNLASALPSGLIPAHAGKTRTLLHQSRAPRAHPRSRGENKLQEALKANAAGSSPLTRGKPLLHRTTQARERLIPAHAGKTPSRSGHTAQAQAHPRSRGENVLPGLPGAVCAGSSPLTRGKLGIEPNLTIARGLIPAHAGKTHARRCLPRSNRAHPRSRGENLSSDSRTFFRTGSSPLTRGKPFSVVIPARIVGLIPAHAGKTSPPPSDRGTTWAHPRSRGENLSALIDGSGQKGSSPLTRGKPAARVSRPATRGLIPAHAGKTTRAQRPALPAGAHPRSRGENSMWIGRPSRVRGSSPLTRGKPSIPERLAPPCGLIPAHAGKTLRKVLQRQHLGAHPRSRGENRQAPDRRQQRSGSSPLTRGKPLPCGRSGRSIWLIPAHAGKTSASPWT